MVYEKTHAGKIALKERHALNLRERQLMVLCNGVRPLDELMDLFGSTVSQDVDRLIDVGYLVARTAANDSQPMALANPEVAPPPPNPSPVALVPPPERFVAIDVVEDPVPPPDPESLPRMSLQALTELAEVPPLTPATLAPVRARRRGEPAAVLDMFAPGKGQKLAADVNSIDGEQVPLRSPVAAQAYMTQVLMALDSDAATALIESSADVRHDVDILLFLAQGLGHTYAVAGEDVALRVAMRTGRLLPENELPMLLDCTLDYVPNGFSVLLYEFVLAGREAVA